MSGKKAPHVWKARTKILAAIEALKSEDRDCPRCDGQGYRDTDEWIVTEEDGTRICFQCKGKGTLSFDDPLKVRYKVVRRLKRLVKQGDFTAIMKIGADEAEGIYYPILVDVFERAAIAAIRISAAKRIAGA